MGKKIDYYGQLVLMIFIGVMAISYPFYPVGIFYSLLALIPLGLWQLTSAGINWFKHQKDEHKIKPLNRYWLYSFICLAIFFISVVFSSAGSFYQYQSLKYLFAASMGGSVIVSIYYIVIYKKFLLHEAKENSGVRGVDETIPL